MTSKSFSRAGDVKISLPLLKTQVLSQWVLRVYSHTSGCEARPCSELNANVNILMVRKCERHSDTGGGQGIIKLIWKQEVNNISWTTVTD